MLLLGIETTSQTAGAALVRDGSVVCEYMLNQKKTHSETLLPMTEQMLAAVGISFPEIDGFACDVGPGSFTGVRIGAATVKGFAQALDKPVVTASSLETLAYGCIPFDGLAVSVLFARADEVFCAAYAQDADGLSPVLPPGVLTADELLRRLPEGPCLFVGDGAALHRAQIERALENRARFAGTRQNLISAANLALLCEQKAQRRGWERYDEISPLYLRVSQAEREYRQKEKQRERKEEKL